jgi:L-fuculose-phosphate aldolase
MAAHTTRRDVVTVCRRLYERGLIAGPDGNVSVRVGPDRILVTPAGLSKVDVAVDDLVEVSLDGRHLRGHRQASSEIGLHLRAYQRRADIGAVVHAHPPFATAFAVSGEGLPSRVLPELILQMGQVPLAPYATPGTQALADACEPILDRHDAFLMANHGATTFGETLTVALQRMESLEHSARILFAARMLGSVHELTPEQVASLIAARGANFPGGPYSRLDVPAASRRQV